MLVLILIPMGLWWAWQREKAHARLQAENAAQSQLIVSNFLQAEGSSLEALDKVALAVAIAPHSPVPARRLLSALTDRNFALPLGAVGQSNGPDSRIIGARYSPDGSRLLTLGLGGSLQVWDSKSGTAVGPQLNHPGSINLFGLSPDGQMVYAATGADAMFGAAELRLWSAGSGAPLTTLPHRHAVRDLRFSAEGGTLTTADSWGIYRWSLDSTQAVSQIPLWGVAAIALSEDGNLAAVSSVGSDATAAFVRDIKSGSALAGPLKAGSRITGLAFDAAARQLWAVCGGGHLHLWRVPEGTSVASGQLGVPLSEVRLNRPGTRALVRGDPNGRSTWLFASTNLAQALIHYPECTFTPGAAFNHDGSRFILVHDTIATLYRSVDGRTDAEPLNAGWWIEDADFDVTGKRLVIAASLPKAIVYDVLPGQASPVSVPLVPGEEVKALSPDGALAALLAANNSVRVVDPITGQEAGRAHLEHPGAVQRIEFGTSPPRLASVCVAGATNLEVRLWDWKASQVIDRPLVFALGDPLLKWDRAMSQLLICGDTNGTIAVVLDGRITTWEFDLAAGVQADRQFGGGQAWDLEFSPDGERFAVASYGGTVQIWSVREQKREHLLIHAGPVFSLSFNRDGRWLATGSLDKAARVWDVATGLPVRPPLWHLQEVVKVRWTPAGDRVLTGTVKGRLSAWDAHNGRRLFEHKAHESAVVQIDVGQANDLIVTRGMRGDVKGWDLASGVQVTDPVEGVPSQPGFALARNGTVLLAPSLSSGLRRFPLPPIPSPALPWLPRIGYGLGGAQPTEELPALLLLRKEALGFQAKGFYEDWARWFFADRETRSPSPWQAENQ